MKKIVSLLLTAVLLAAMLTVFAVPAFAEGEAESIDKPEGAEWLVDEGDNHVWYELTENETKLIIGGEGAMPDYDYFTLENRPWHSAAETVTTVQINSGITALGDFAFFYFEKMTSVTIPESVNTIGPNAFFGCKGLTSIVIPSSVESIGQSAFQSCDSLQSVTIPSSVNTIGPNAFCGCANLQSVTIPSSVTSIGSNAFQSCISLQSVTIPSSVTKIEGSTFNSCNQLASVTVKTSTPPTLGKKAFNGTPGNLAIYVPCGAVDAYQEAWSSYRDQIKEAYVVDDQPGENGTVTFDKDTFPKETYTEPSETVTVTVMPAEGYQLQADSLLVKYKDENGEEMTADLTQDETDPMKYTFTMPCSNVTVKAAFEEITDESGTTPTSSTLSEGNIWIIIAVAVVVIAGVATLVIVKKKTKPALADGTDNTDEE